MRFTQSRCNKFKPPAGKADHVEFDEEMPGFGMRFRNGGPGTFFMQYRIGTKDGRLSLGKVAKVSLVDAREAAKAQFAMVANRVRPAVERARATAATSETIEPLIDDFLGYLERNGRAPTYIAEKQAVTQKVIQAAAQVRSQGYQPAYGGEGANPASRGAGSHSRRSEPSASQQILLVGDFGRSR